MNACFYYCLQILGKIQKYNRKNTSNEQAKKQTTQRENKQRKIYKIENVL